MAMLSKNRFSIEDEWLITTRDRAPSHDGGSMWFMLAIGFVSFMWDWAGQLEESGEYRTERLRVFYIHIRSFEGGSPRLCRLRTTSVGPCCNKH
jgi:hypothetical protein